MEVFIYQAIGMLIFLIYPVWRIFKRAGINPLFSLVLFIPYGGIFLAGLVLTFSKWRIVATESQEA